MKNFILLTALTSVFLALPKDEVKAFQTHEMKQSDGVRLEIFPVKSSTIKTKECLLYKDESLFPLTKTPALIIENFQYQRVTGNDPGIKIYLSKKNSRELKKLTKKYTHSRLAVLQDGKVITTPYMTTSESEGPFKLVFNGRESFNSILKKL